MSRLTVSVVVVTYRRPRELESCLKTLAAQTLRPTQLVVIDNSAAENGEAQRICDSVADIIDTTCIANPQNSLPGARNLGVRHCTSDLVALIDDDVRIGTGYLDAVATIFEQRPEAVGVQGYIVPGERPRWRERLHRLFGLYHLEPNACRVLPTISTTYPSRLDRTIPCEWMSGSNQVYRRGVLAEERWDERLLKYADGEDLDFSYRLYRRYPGALLITPDAQVLHDESSTGRAVGAELLTMREVYGWYLHKKLFRGSRNALLAYVWSRLGRLILSIGVMATFRRTSAAGDVRAILHAYWLVWRNASAFSGGDFGVFNMRYLQMKG